MMSSCRSVIKCSISLFGDLTLFKFQEIIYCSDFGFRLSISVCLRSQYISAYWRWWLITNVDGDAVWAVFWCSLGGSLLLAVVCRLYWNHGVSSEASRVSNLSAEISFWVPWLVLATLHEACLITMGLAVLIPLALIAPLKLPLKELLSSGCNFFLYQFET